MEILTRTLSKFLRFGSFYENYEQIIIYELFRSYSIANWTIIALLFLETRWNDSIQTCQGCNLIISECETNGTTDNVQDLDREKKHLFPLKMSSLDDACLEEPVMVYKDRRRSESASQSSIHNYSANYCCNIVGKDEVCCKYFFSFTPINYLSNCNEIL